MPKKELEQAVKNICLNPNVDDHEYILALQGKRWELDTVLEKVNLEIKSREKLKIEELKNLLNKQIVASGYELDQNQVNQIELEDNQ